MGESPVKSAYERLRLRVHDVARLRNRCAQVEGGGRFVWLVGAPLLAALLVDMVLGLPLLLRVLILPLAAFGVVWCGWRLLVRPLLNRCRLTRAAMLIETARPEMKSRVISALQLYPELEKDHTPFDPAMLNGLVLYAQESTASEDFRAVVDRGPSRRAALAAGATVIAWIAAFVVNPAGMAGAFGRLGTAWQDVRQIALQVSGAKIVFEKLDRPAYLRGTDVKVRALQKGFRSDSMEIYVRPVSQNGSSTDEWLRQALAVDAAGKGEFVMKNAQMNFECYCASGRIQSERLTVVVTERPRIAKLSVEYDLPAYVRRAPIVQPRSDGNLKALYGSSILLTIEANKNLKSAVLRTSYQKKADTMSVGGQFAQGSIAAESDRWLKDNRQEIEESYTIELSDEYGYTNEDANTPHKLVVTKDQAPTIEFVGLPHRSSAQEPHVPEKDLDRVNLAVRGLDDYGIAKVTLHYRIEDLETGQEKGKGSKPVAFGLPPTQVSLGLARASQLGLQVGDRLTFWAEAEDAYDLDPQAGPHKTTTPPYRIAIVTEEQLFSEVRYRDEWSAQWYDSLKVATLARRAPPPRTAPEGEPAGNVAKKLLDAIPTSETFRGEAAQAIEHYFQSLAGTE